MEAPFTDKEIAILNDKFGFWFRESGSNGLSQISGQSLLGANGVEGGLSDTRSQVNGVCSICCEDFKLGVRGVELPECEHRFCEMCIDEWVKIKVQCPYCRNNVRLAMIKRFHLQRCGASGQKKLIDSIKKETESRVRVLELIPDEFRPMNHANI
jgi:hypothetical protein